MSLNNLMTMKMEEAINFDLKNQFAEELYGSDYYGQTNLDKWGKYYSNATKKGLDCDVSKMSMEFFAEFVKQKLEIDAELLPQTKKRNKFQIKIHENDFLRLDTMNSMWSTLKDALQIGFKNETGQLSHEYDDMCIRTGIDTNQNLGAQLDRLVGKYALFINDKTLWCNLEEFAVRTHTMGNLLLYPFEVGESLNFNQSRGMNSKIKDYLDLTLLSIYKWYIDGVEDNNPLQKVLEAKKAWFIRFGEGLEGWKSYVRMNCLEDFVDLQKEHYPPILFWEGHSFTNPLLGRQDKQYLSQDEVIKRINKFLEFVNHAIEKRGERLYKATLNL